MAQRIIADLATAPAAERVIAFFSNGTFDEAPQRVADAARALGHR
jgi:hypothetical protein